ncbi:MAG: cyclase family protein [Bacteroidota bacterium]
MKSIIQVCILSILLFSCQAQKEESTPTDVHPLNSGQWIDLSYTYDENTIYWPTADGFKLDTVFEGETDGGYYYSAFNFSSAEHGGTHLDAPIHFSEGKQSVDQLTIDQLTGEAIVIDVSDNALKDNDYQVSVEDLTSWEVENGDIPKDAIVLIRTGYGQFWPDREKYMGTTEIGAEAVAKLHFPGLSPEAAKWLTGNRDIKAIGLDTPSIDYGQSQLFESHQILFGKNIPAFENVANLDKLPAKGAFVIALPMKIKGGSGGPLRIVAHIP